MAMNSFISELILLNNTDNTPLYLTNDILFSPPRADPNIAFNKTNQIQK